MPIKYEYDIDRNKTDKILGRYTFTIVANSKEAGEALIRAMHLIMAKSAEIESAAPGKQKEAVKEVLTEKPKRPANL